jgi:hypothetical protein
MFTLSASTVFYGASNYPMNIGADGFDRPITKRLKTLDAAPTPEQVAELLVAHGAFYCYATLLADMKVTEELEPQEIPLPSGKVHVIEPFIYAATNGYSVRWSKA